MLDRIFFWEQESILKYWEWEIAGQYFKDDVANLYVAGTHSQRKYEMMVAGFTYNEELYEISHSYSKYFRAEDKDIKLVGVYQNTTNVVDETFGLYDPYELYVVYTIPEEGYRAKILRLQLDTVEQDT